MTLYLKSARPVNSKIKLNQKHQFNLEFQSTKEYEQINFNISYIRSVELDNSDLVIAEKKMGPIPIGNFKFTIEGDPVDFRQIDKENLFGVTSIVISGRFPDNFEFVRICFIVKIHYPGIPNNMLESNLEGDEETESEETEYSEGDTEYSKVESEEESERGEIFTYQQENTENIPENYRLPILNFTLDGREILCTYNENPIVNAFQNDSTTEEDETLSEE